MALEITARFLTIALRDAAVFRGPDVGKLIRVLEEPTGSGLYRINKPGTGAGIYSDVEGGGGGGGAAFVDVINPTFPYTASAGERVITTAEMVTQQMNLPSSPTAGDRVAFYGTATGGMTLLNTGRNGENIMGEANNDQLQFNQPPGARVRAGAIYCYIDSAIGWLIETDG